MIVQMNQEGDVPTELESVSSVNSDKSYAFNLCLKKIKKKEMICHFSIQADGILFMGRFTQGCNATCGISSSYFVCSSSWGGV